ncbi:MAG: cysteine desulfurase CsdA, partial [Candidatus Nephrothrix sp. EaCA]
EIIISALEHHSNIVPWQMAAQKSGAILKVIPLTETLELDMEAYKKMLSPKTKAVAVNHASNSVGTVNPIREVIKLAHQAGALVLIDGAQGIAHLPVDVQELDCDFYAFSGHKMYGPTGIGILYGKRAVLEKIPPYMGGGEMIKEVTFEKTTYNDLPYKFEAGTPNIADSIALKTAVDFIAEIGKKEIAQYENELLLRVTKALQNLPQVKIIGTAKEKVGIVSFVVNGIHPFDVGQWLDAQGIAVRTGHHCAQPLMTCLKLEGTVRASFALYNTKEEIDFFIENLQHCIKKLG